MNNSLSKKFDQKISVDEFVTRLGFTHWTNVKAFIDEHFVEKKEYTGDCGFPIDDKGVCGRFNCSEHHYIAKEEEPMLVECSECDKAYYMSKREYRIVPCPFCEKLCARDIKTPEILYTKEQTNPTHYTNVHKWLIDTYGYANHCEDENCKTPEYEKFEYSLIHGKPYELVKSYYKMLCVPCHRKYDGGGLSVCSVGDCEEPYHSSGYCNRHYNKFYWHNYEKKALSKKRPEKNGSYKDKLK